MTKIQEIKLGAPSHEWVETPTIWKCSKCGAKSGTARGDKRCEQANHA